MPPPPSADLATERLPVSRRPTGPSGYDHALRAAAMLLRVVHSRVVGMDTLIRRSGTLPVEPAAAALVDDVAVQLVACQSVLDALAAGRRGAAVEAMVTMPPDVAVLGRAFATYEVERLAAVESVLHMEIASETQLRFDSMTAELAEVTASLVRATRSAALLPEQPQPAGARRRAAVRRPDSQRLGAVADQPGHPRAPAVGHPAELGPARARPVGRPARRGRAGPVARFLGPARDAHPAADDHVRDPRRPAAGAAGDAGRSVPGRRAAGAVRGAHRRLRRAAAGGHAGGAGRDPARAPGRRTGVLHAGGGRPVQPVHPVGLAAGRVARPRRPGGRGDRGRHRRARVAARRRRAAACSAGPLRPRDREAGAAVGRAVRRRRRRARGPSASCHPLRRGPRGRDVLPVHGRVAGGAPTGCPSCAGC